MGYLQRGVRQERYDRPRRSTTKPGTRIAVLEQEWNKDGSAAERLGCTRWRARARRFGSFEDRRHLGTAVADHAGSARVDRRALAESGIDDELIRSGDFTGIAGLRRPTSFSMPILAPVD